MLLSITHNPYTETPQTLWDELAPRKSDAYYEDNTYDRAGLEALKSTFNKPANPENG